MLASLSENKKILHLNQSIQNLKLDIDANSFTANTQVRKQQSTHVEAFFKSLEQRHNDEAAYETLALYNVAQTSNCLNAQNNVGHVLTTMKVIKTSVKQSKRLGPANSDTNARHQPLEVVFSSVCDRRTALTNAPLLNGWGAFAKKHSRKNC